MGRNKKMVREGMVQEHIAISYEYDKRLRKEAELRGMTFRELLESLLSSITPELREREELEKKKNELELELAYVNYNLSQIKVREEQRSEFEKKLSFDRQYCSTAFRILYNTVEHRSAEKMILINEAIIESTYGISFNVKKCNENFSKIGEMKDDELIQFLNLKRVGHSKKEEEILRVIKDE